MLGGGSGGISTSSSSATTPQLCYHGDVEWLTYMVLYLSPNHSTQYICCSSSSSSKGSTGNKLLVILPYASECHPCSSGCIGVILVMFEVFGEDPWY